MNTIMPSKHSTLISASIMGITYPLFHLFDYCEPIWSVMLTLLTYGLIHIR